MLPNNTIHAAGPALCGAGAHKDKRSDDRSDTDSRNHPDRPGGCVLRRRFDIDEFGPRFGAGSRGVDVASASTTRCARYVRRWSTSGSSSSVTSSSTTPPTSEFGRRLGELTFGHPVWNSDDVPAEVYSLDSANGFADVWRTDVTFMQRPHLARSCVRLCCPRNGGDTNWADAELATNHCRNRCAA